ncbi:hypothetical protein BCR44DRAFT_1533305 [Catenaria anguillulae PL171]|uniref:G-protein coupled receptors family 1 profile domain-containing protein n=1 Tax=Catenaria anguillulae PL171 TaxID=765915 RepID=A0A1Y2HLX7_9FUNG|nr:hypothetical protein BCR44DRAFT_1533305 [Catenaria anguillulae PL171]
MEPENELQAVQRAPYWDPLNYDHDMFPISKAVSHFIIGQALLIVFMNGAVVLVAARSRHLLDSAANVFYVGMCLNNWLYGAIILAYRIGFAAFGFHWTEASCFWYSALNVFCVGTGALHVLTVCMERYLTLIKLKRLSVRQAFLSVGGLYGQSAAFTSLHYIFGGKGMIANSGFVHTSLAHLNDLLGRERTLTAD